MKPSDIDNLLNQLRQRGVFSWKGVVVKEQNTSDEPAVEEHHISVIDLEGLKTADVTTLKIASGCHHILNRPDAIGAACSVCGKYLCASCSRNLCSVCSQVVCGQHRRPFNNGLWICHPCYKTWLRQNGLLALCCAVVVAILTVLLCVYVV